MADVTAGFLVQLRALGLPEPVREHRFHADRRWRFDFAWPAHGIALEVEGVVYPRRGRGYQLGGRHVSVRGFKGDCEKYLAAFELGWNVVRVLPDDIRSGRAAQALARRIPRDTTNPFLRLVDTAGRLTPKERADR